MRVHKEHVRLAQRKEHEELLGMLVCRASALWTGGWTFLASTLQCCGLVGLSYLLVSQGLSALLGLPATIRGWVLSEAA